jgi:hypothetical protein
MLVVRPWGPGIKELEPEIVGADRDVVVGAPHPTAHFIDEAIEKELLVCLTARTLEIDDLLLQSPSLHFLSLQLLLHFAKVFYKR